MPPGLDNGTVNAATARVLIYVTISRKSCRRASNSISSAAKCRILSEMAVCIVRKREVMRSFDILVIKDELDC